MFFPETVLKRIHYCYIRNVEGKTEKKKLVLSSSLRIPDPSLLGDPQTSYQLA